MTIEREANKTLSRRKFILGAGAVATGIMATGLVGCGQSEPTNSESTEQPAATPVASLPALPWKMEKLDVDAVRKRGFDGYHEGGCMYGAAKALIDELAEKAGAPWDALQTDAYRYGAGGGYGWGTLCGALNGALAVFNLGVKEHSALGNELLGWYTLFPFPSDKHEEYCKFKGQVTTVAGSPLCHASVSKWANEAGAKVNSEEKYDRCAKLTGDTAAKAAELINAYIDGNFQAAYEVPAEYASCMGCHQGESSAMDNEQGKMNCLDCHDDHTKK